MLIHKFTVIFGIKGAQNPFLKKMWRHELKLISNINVIFLLELSQQWRKINWRRLCRKTLSSCVWIFGPYSSPFTPPIRISLCLLKKCHCLKILKSEVQAALVICGLFIRGYAYTRSRKIHQNSLFAVFPSLNHD